MGTVLLVGTLRRLGCGDDPAERRQLRRRVRAISLILALIIAALVFDLIST